MINLNQLLHFKLVAEEGSFLRAAEKINLSQPAISHSIKSLEARLGGQLIDRSNRSIKLTSIGIECLTHTNRLLSQVNNFETSMENMRSGISGYVSVGMGTLIGEKYGGSIVSTFCGTNPNVSVGVSIQNSEQLLDRLVAETDHFSICDAENALARQEVESVKWRVMTGGFFCRIDHPILSSEPPSIELISNYGFVSISFNRQVKQNIVRNVLAYEGEDNLFRVESDNMNLCREVAINTNYILISDVDYVLPDLTAGNLIEIEVDFDLRRDLCIARKAGRVLPKAAERMIEFLLDESSPTIETSV